MIHIDPSTLYSRGELLEMFAEMGIDWDAFVARIKPRKVTGRGYWGAHLIAAITASEETPARVRRSHKLERAAQRGRRSGGELIDQALEHFGMK